ncbi:gamma-mobile-trio protein GmtX [Thalassotalea psychrophila]|uniref:Gamma-mobile-trio protein GmtX n=1 Tax=Thalassotalea psychrophila TaxID=3065647 RepID=A0ABY9TPC0_9GAMM|nr:gamma-mobile-trio protein GmtX [Colwelliaceae bacterium SQ149]
MIHEPNELCEKLKQDVTSRTARSLDIIHKVCTDQAERGGSDFSIATIGRLSAAAYGPKAQAIRNKTGEKYRVLIESWAVFKKPLKVISNKVQEKDSWVDEITDRRIMWLVRDLIAEKSRLKGQLQLAKEHAGINIDLRPVVANRGMADNSQQSVPHHYLYTQERTALLHAIDPKVLIKKGWTTDKRGKVKDEDGNLIFKAGFITAIEKILSV